MKTSKTITLTNGEHLVVTMFSNESNVLCYRASCSSDMCNHGFEGDRGEVKEGETLDSITDELTSRLEDNIKEWQVGKSYNCPHQL